MPRLTVPPPARAVLRCVAPGCKAPRPGTGAFCEDHALAPAVQRGGWLSAERRRLARGQSGADEAALDASCVARRLWVGGVPPFDRELPTFDLVVLCAQELQPARETIRFRGKHLRVPLPDADLTHNQVCMALAGGQRVAKALVAGQTVLVTCQMGINRSALVAMLGLGLVTRLSSDELVALVRQRRLEECLGNAFFVDVLKRYIGAGRRAPLGALPP